MGPLQLKIEQIIPVKDVAEITISLNEKVHDGIVAGAEIAERELIRRKIWKELLLKINYNSHLFNGINAGTGHYDHWLTSGAGTSGLGYSFVVT